MSEKSSVAKIAEPFVCGGSAATFASIVIHPMDLAKVRMQLYGQLNPGKPVPSFVELLSSMVKKDGIASVYKGVDAAVGRQLVYGTARIGLHRAISDKMKEINEGRPISFMMKTLSGMASGSIAVCIGTPCELLVDVHCLYVCLSLATLTLFLANTLFLIAVDIALVRLQSDSMAPANERKNYKNVFDVSYLDTLMNIRCVHFTKFSITFHPKALKRTVSEEGVSALYKGLAPNILRGMSMNVGMLACYDQAKEGVAKILNDPMTNGPALTTQIGASCVAVSIWMIQKFASTLLPCNAKTLFLS
jgi:solute carrier family 25 oxoglutarate transporter 11